VILYNPTKKRRCKMSQSSGTSLEPNVAGALSYALGWITGLVFFLLEKDDDFVRFHAMQSIVLFGLLTIIWIIGMIFWWIVPVLAWIVWTIVWIGTLILWIILMIKAYQGEKWKLPLIGDLAEKWQG
jgi:uncharacterized membrane protein